MIIIMAFVCNETYNSSNLYDAEWLGGGDNDLYISFT